MGKDYGLLDVKIGAARDYAKEAHERCSVLESAIRGFEARLSALEPSQPQGGRNEQPTPTNSDYATALRVIKEYEKCHPSEIGLDFFGVWCARRLNGQ